MHEYIRQLLKIFVNFGPSWPEVLSAYKKPAQSGFPAVQHSDQRTGCRLQAIRRKQESEEQEHKPAQWCRREKEADPEDRNNDRGNRQEESAEVKEEPAQGSQQGEDKGKGSGDYFQYHLHSGNLLLIFLPIFYHVCPGT